jgi:cell division protein FtsB
VASVFALIKFGLGEKGSLTITQAQGANTILNAALESLNKELVRKDQLIEDLSAERDQLREELKKCRQGPEA